MFRVLDERLVDKKPKRNWHFYEASRPHTAASTSKAIANAIAFFALHQFNALLPTLHRFGLGSICSVMGRIRPGVSLPVKVANLIQPSGRFATN
jgi:hypothetical protein